MASRSLVIPRQADSTQGRGRKGVPAPPARLVHETGPGMRPARSTHLPCLPRLCHRAFEIAHEETETSRKMENGPFILRKFRKIPRDRIVLVKYNGAHSAAEWCESTVQPMVEGSLAQGDCIHVFASRVGICRGFGLERKPGDHVVRSALQVACRRRRAPRSRCRQAPQAPASRAGARRPPASRRRATAPRRPRASRRRATAPAGPGQVDAELRRPAGPAASRATAPQATASAPQAPEQADAELRRPAGPGQVGPAGLSGAAGGVSLDHRSPVVRAAGDSRRLPSYRHRRRAPASRFHRGSSGSISLSFPLSRVSRLHPLAPSSANRGERAPRGPAGRGRPTPRR